MPVKLILTDIDGTVLPHGQAHVGQPVTDAFCAAAKAGIYVGPCTGRSYSWVQPIFCNNAACYQTAVATNGMQVYVNGQLALQKTIAREALLAMREVVSKTPRAGMLCFDGAKPLLLEGSQDDLAKLFPAYATSCEIIKDVPTFDVVKANVFTGGSEADAKDLVAAINDQVDAVDVDRALPRYSNVMPRGWNKGTGIAWLCDYLGIAADEVVAFGDANNDLPMFAAVPNSVAVANATPEAAAAARWHIGPCDKNAVPAAIESLAAGTWPFTS